MNHGSLDLFEAPAPVFTDEQLEIEIQQSLAALIAAPVGDYETVRPFSVRMSALIKQRSARRVAEMERQKGLCR